MSTYLQLFQPEIKIEVRHHKVLTHDSKYARFGDLCLFQQIFFKQAYPVERVNPLPGITHERFFF